jgi:hypothetical protein
VDAKYPGDTNYSTSTSATTSLTSSKQYTVFDMTASPVGSILGQSMTLTGTLTPYSAGNLTTSGELVNLFNNGVSIGGLLLNSSGVAVGSTSSLPAGTNKLTAVYPGDTNFLTSTGALEYTVDTVGVDTTATLTLSPVSPVTSGTAVTFTATVSNGSAVTLGTVNFCDTTKGSCTGLGLIGTAQLTSAGTAVIVRTPGIGSHSYTAIFAGINGSIDPATSPAQPLVVTAAAKFTTTSTISSTGSVGNYTLTGTVAGTGSLSPTGYAGAGLHGAD